jgi:hypothetical protein
MITAQEAAHKAMQAKSAHITHFEKIAKAHLPAIISFVESTIMKSVDEGQLDTSIYISVIQKEGLCWHRIIWDDIQAHFNNLGYVVLFNSQMNPDYNYFTISWPSS